MKRNILLFVGIAAAFTACKKNDSNPGIPGQPVAADTIAGNISNNVTLVAGRDYVVNGKVYVNNNASLTIPAGTTLRMVKHDAAEEKSSLVVTAGAKLFINGTADQPVIFTSDASQKAAGDWGALIILGNAPTNTGTGHIAGFPVEESTRYGGTVSDDNSGSITYLRVEYAGGINADGEDEWKVDKAAGLVLASVGSGTTINHVMVTQSNDDGFQFVGGTVNATHLLGYNNNDDDFDFDLGYTGKLQYLIAYRAALPGAHAIRANGLETYNDEVPTLNTPLTRPVISNMTIIGPDGDNNSTGNLNQGVYIRKGTRFVLQNSIVADYAKGALMVCNKTRPVLLNNDGSLFRYNLVQSDSSQRTFSWDKDYAVFGDSVLRAFALNGINHNEAFNTTAEIGLTGMHTAVPNLSPAAGSPALSGASFAGADFQDFFTQVSFRGAIGAENWAAAGNWAKW